MSFNAKTFLERQFDFLLLIADQVSSVFWLVHSDLHEPRVTAVLEYMSSMVACLEPINQLTNGQAGELDNLPLVEQNLKKGKFNVRFKRRNGRVRLMVISLPSACVLV